MILEFFAKHRQLLILMCVLAVYGVFKVIENIVTILVILSNCHLSTDNIDILCQIFNH